MEQPLVRLIAGLGNPGARYERTRHNIGFRVVDALSERMSSRRQAGVWRTKGDALVCEAEIAGSRVFLVKPLSFMNRSGFPVGELQRFYKIEREEVLAVHDDVDLPFGQLRMKRGGGDAGHNGVASLMAGLGGAAFLRVRCGVGRPEGERQEQEMVDWVLGRFDAEEERQLPEFLSRAVDAIEALCEQGLGAAQNKFNRRSE